MIAFVLLLGSLGLVAGSSYPVPYTENTTTKRPTRPWETRPWAYSTKAWNRGFSTRNRSYPTHLPTQQWDPYANNGHDQGQIVRFPDGQIVQYGRNTGVYGPHMTTPVIHYNQGMVPTQSWKNLPECKEEQSERCYRECEERKIHSFTCRPQFGVAFTCLCSVSIYIPNVAV